jgi:hypothetical protein
MEVSFVSLVSVVVLSCLHKVQEFGYAGNHSYNNDHPIVTHNVVYIAVWRIEFKILNTKILDTFQSKTARKVLELLRTDCTALSSRSNHIDYRFRSGWESRIITMLVKCN